MKLPHRISRFCIVDIQMASKGDVICADYLATAMEATAIVRIFFIYCYLLNYLVVTLKNCAPSFFGTESVISLMVLEASFSTPSGTAKVFVSLAD